MSEELNKIFDRLDKIENLLNHRISLAEPLWDLNDLKIHLKYNRITEDIIKKYLGFKVGNEWRFKPAIVRMIDNKECHKQNGSRFYKIKVD